MIWLASYPRSGNTFLRIILWAVYGTDSTELLPDGSHARPFSPSPGSPCLVVKTHLRPDQLVPSDRSIPAVYLIRDGRDAAVSRARRKSQVIRPGSDYAKNLEEIIRLPADRDFGGWSDHVTAWAQRASLIIRFEELVVDPVGCVERLRPYLDLPAPDLDRLPTFEELQSGDYPLGGLDRNREDWRRNFFRRGKVGSWKDEMPPRLEDLFWKRHGRTMEAFGYLRDAVHSPAQRAWWFVRGCLWDDRRWAGDNLLRRFYRAVNRKRSAPRRAIEPADAAANPGSTEGSSVPPERS